MGAPANILIVDDDRTNRLVLRSLLSGFGFNSIEAEDGRQAIEKLMLYDVDVVLMDVMMPVLDGYQAAKEIKNLSSKFIPIIFLTALTDDNALARAIEAGGDDFLSKPYSHVVLEAKINSMLRISTLYKKVTEQNIEIERHNVRLKQEMEIAQKLFQNHSINSFDASQTGLRYSMSPISMFNGDIILLDSNKTRGYEILMGDFTGHGLSAAIGSIPVADVFHTMLEKGYSYQETLIEINNKLQKLLPTQIFMAAAYVSVDRLNNVISVVNAGLPNIYIIRGNKIVHEFASKNIPLGIENMESGQFEIQMEGFHYGDKLLMASDGIIEAENLAGELFGKRRLTECIANSPVDGDLFDEILNSCKEFSTGKEQGDDITLLELVHLEKITSNKQPDIVEYTESGKWSIHYELDIISLKKIDVLPHIMQYINNLHSIPNGRSTLYTILSEAYNNALDHGLLKLDSSLKDSDAGYLGYYKERNQRLEEMSAGTINIFIMHEVHSVDYGRLIIEVSDTGDGFDYRQCDVDSEKVKKYSGRGITLLKKLCSDVQYYGKGNKVKLVYDWRRS